jgi:hypothetical protein
MLRKFLAVTALAASILGVTATAASADSTSIPAPIGGTASITVTDVQYTAAGDCIDTPVSVAIAAASDYAYLDWEYTATYTGPTSWPVSAYGYGYNSGTFAESFTICPAFDQPGAYVGSLSVNFYDYNYHLLTTTTVTDPFTVAAYVPPAPPAPPAPPVPAPAPPAPPAPAPVPAPVVWDVGGEVSANQSPRKIALTFTASSYDAFPNTVQGRALTWKVKVDGKVRKTIVQNREDVDHYAVKFARHTGTHKVQVFKNNHLHRTYRVTT